MTKHGFTREPEFEISHVGEDFVDLVLMDLQFGGEMQGVEATRLIRALEPPPYVLILTN